ncbi:hypothetical protein JR316_0005657 [Psilocybe cubensis]|uniref:Uncharacterized protein n=2 Tax=Psilocybe cubensis TaxID=181762 RepID=A0ACB8H0H5_PSICU|nr:hypothetical protein JR316_0005657 [Psilocybe cubensis]KAH9481137.1 hypothetical protein JR316_0005657 [Psilocybe cubensis]
MYDTHDLRHVENMLDSLPITDENVNLTLNIPSQEDIVRTRCVSLDVQNQSQSSLPLIHRMPDEMLGEIFLACLSPHCTREALKDQDRQFPILPMFVCRRWRNVAVSTPRLWTQLDIDIPRTKRVSLRRQQIQDQIARSGVCPLDVSIWFPEVCGRQWEETDGPRYDKANQLTGPLFSEQHRWRSVRLEGASQITEILTQLNPSKLTALEEVELNLDGKFYSSLPADFLQAPKLKHLGLRRRLTVPTILSTPWHRLIHLSFTVWEMPDSSPTQTLAEMLALCQNLTSCFIRLYGWVYRTPDTTESDHYPLIRLPNLSTLKIYEGKPSSIHTSWDLPRLRDVEFHVTEVIPPHDQSASLRAIIERTEGTIQKLTTQIDMHKQGDLIGCLDRCTDLRSLVLELPPPIHVGSQAGWGYALAYPTEPEGLPHDDLLECLMPGHGPGNTTRCPKLESFRWCTERQDVSKLKHIVVNFGNDWKETKMLESLEKLSAFIEDGLVVEFL